MNEEYTDIELNGVQLRVFKNGAVAKYPIITGGNKIVYDYGLLKQTIDNGYLIVCIGKKLTRKKYLVHRILGMAYLGLDLTNTKLVVDHIDRCKINNNITNLRIVSRQENTFNTNATGISYEKQRQKFKSSICINDKRINLGRFDNEEDARKAYIEAKEKYHVFSHPHHH